MNFRNWTALRWLFTCCTLLSFDREGFLVKLGIALVVLAEKFRCDDFGFRPPQFHILLLLADSDRAAHDIDANEGLTLFGKRPVDEEGGRVRVRRSSGEQE